MAKTVGFTFSVGARLQSSVASVFDTVAGRASRLKKDIKQLQAVSGAASKLTTNKDTLTSLRAEVAAGADKAKELLAAERAYKSAERAAEKYNITIKEAASVHAKATAQIARTEEALKRQEAYQRNSTKRSELKGEMFGAVAGAGIAVAPIKMAMDFESAMADAAKTIDGMRDNAGNLTDEYYNMEATVKRMGQELPLTHQELAGIFAAGGQLGLKTADELEEFTRLAAHMSVAFGVSTDEAAETIGGYRSQMGKTFPEIREMLDLMNQYANTSSATEASISNIVREVGSLGQTAGLSDEALTAMAATLSAMKIQDNKAGTGIKNFLLTFTAGGMGAKSKQDAFAALGIKTDELAKEMQKDAEGAILAVLKKIQALPKHLQAGFLEQLFGRESISAIAPLLTRLDLLEENFAKAGDKASYLGAMQKEFENRSKTTANALIITKNKVAALGITIGAALLPAVNDILSVVGNATVAVTAFAEANPAVIRVVMLAVTALTAFKLASVAGGFALTVASDAWTMAKGAWAAGRAVCNLSTASMVAQRVASFGLAAGVRTLAIAQRVLNVVMANNPIGWVVKGVMVLGGALYGLYQTCEPVRKVLDSLWDGFMSAIKPVTDFVSSIWDKVTAIINWVSGESSEANAKADETLAAQQTVAGTQAVAETSIAAVPQNMSLPQASVFSDTNTAADLEDYMAMAPSTLDAESMDTSFEQAGVLASLENFSTASTQSTSMAASLSPTFSFTFNMDGVPDKEFGRRVIESLEKEKSAIQRMLSNMLSDAQRVAYN